MRCPTCHYLSFEPESRCRNCGYDFALAEAEADEESAGALSMRPVDDSDAVLADFDLHQAPPPRPVAVPPASTLSAMDSSSSSSSAERRSSSSGSAAVALAEPPLIEPPLPRPIPARAPTTTAELPLFVRGLPPPELPSESKVSGAEVPLILVPPTRPPLAVRRRAPDSGSAGPSPVAPRTASAFSALSSAKSGGAEHGRLLDVASAEPVWAPLPAERPATAPVESRKSSRRAAPRERVLAALVDAALLAAIDGGILWFTLRICALTIGQARALPLLPLGVFCALLDVGYLLMFTATSGQTVGKMAAGIRVIAVSDNVESTYVPMRQALLRAVLTLPSLAAAGAGFLPALFGRGPAVHDRIAHTRVVRT